MIRTFHQNTVSEIGQIAGGTRRAAATATNVNTVISDARYQGRLPKSAADIANDVNDRVKDSMGESTGGNTTTRESLTVSKDTIWVKFWDNSGHSPQHHTHKIHIKDTSEYNTGYKRTTGKFPAMERR